MTKTDQAPIVEEDSDLVSMLEEIDGNIEDIIEDPVPDQTPVETPVETPPVKEFVDPVLESVQTTYVEPEIFKDKPEDETSKKINELIKLFSSTVEIIVNNYSTDREQVESAISYFEEQVKVARAAKEKLPPSIIEGWVKLLTVKAEINSNSVGVLDSMAKLLAAAKNNNLIINIGEGKSGGLDLEKLLSQEPKDDET